MKIEMALTARRTALTLAVAGVLLGFAAPAASAAPADDSVQDGPSYVIDGPGKKNGKGPIDFIVDGKGGREPVFICDADKPNKRKNNCVAPVLPTGPRF